MAKTWLFWVCVLLWGSASSAWAVSETVVDAPQAVSDSVDVPETTGATKTAIETETQTHIAEDVSPTATTSDVAELKATFGEAQNTLDLFVHHKGEDDPVLKGAVDVFSAYERDYFDANPLFQALAITATIHAAAGEIYAKKPPLPFRVTTAEYPFNVLTLNKSMLLDEKVLNNLGIKLRLEKQANRLTLFPPKAIRKAPPPMPTVKDLILPVDYDDSYMAFYQVRIGRMISDGLIDTYTTETPAFYLPMTQLNEMLNFAMEVDLEAETLSGWAIEQGHDIAVNWPSRTAVAKGETIFLYPGDAFVEEDDLWLSNRVLSKLMPIDFYLNSNGGTVKLEPRTLLPFQEKMQRKKDRELWESRRKRPKVVYPSQTIDYRWAQKPAFSVNVGTSAGLPTHEKASLDSTWGMGFTGDFLKFSSALTLGGTDRDALKSARFAANRYDPSGKVGYTSFDWGDVSAFTAPLVGSGGAGRGVTLTNRPASRPENFDTTSFEGELKKGWEVELYRNDVLVAFQTLDDDAEAGSYNFRDIPIQYGNNDFVLRFYGPRGEVEEERVTKNINASLLLPGEWQYRAAAVERGKTLLGFDDVTAGHYFGAVQVDLGLYEKLSGSVGFFMDQDPMIKGRYISAALTQQVPGALVNWQFAKDLFREGWVASAKTNTRLGLETFLGKRWGGLGIQLGHQYMHNWQAPRTFGDTNLLVHHTTLGLSGVIPLWERYWPNKVLTYTLDNDWRYHAEKNWQYTLNTNLSGTLFHRLNMGLSNRWVFKGTLDDASAAAPTNPTWNGNFTLRRAFIDTSVRFSMPFTVWPEFSAPSVNLTVQKPLTPRLASNFSLNQSIAGETTANASGGLIFREGGYILSLSASADNHRNLSLGVNIASSFFPHPKPAKESSWCLKLWRWLTGFETSQDDLSGGGGSYGRAFIDRNFNGEFDADEEIMEQAKFKKHGRVLTGKEHLGGMAFIPGLAHNGGTEVVLLENSLDDPMLVAPTLGVELFSRRGVGNVLNFPVVETTEMEGEITLDGSPLGGLHIVLWDEVGNLKHRAKSEFDGYYLIDKIVPGTYTVAPDSTDLGKVGAEAFASQKVTFSRDLDSEYLDFHLLTPEGISATTDISGTEAEEIEEAPESEKGDEEEGETKDT